MAPLTDKNLLEYVSLLIGKVKESQAEGKCLDKVYSLLEFLLSYRDAATESPKKKAYEAVNSYQQQVDLVIHKLENRKNLAGNYLKRLVASQNQAELNIIYNEVKKSPEFSQTDNQKIVDNHQKRVQVALELETKPAVPEIGKQLAIKLRTVINGDSATKDLENLQKELKEYQNSPEQEKKTVYNQYHQTIEATLAEIASELVRRNQSQQDQNKVPAPTGKQSQNPANQHEGSVKPTVIFLGGVVLLILLTFLAYQVFLLRKKRQKKLLKKRKR